MKQKLIILLTIGLLLAVMMFGIVKRQTYTNVTKQDAYLDQVMVAELTEKIAGRECAAMSQKLPDAPIILRVEVTGKLEHLFAVDRHKAVIKQVYAGNGVQKEEEIYLFSRHWTVDLLDTPNTIGRGFVNILQENTEYLVFAESVGIDEETGLPLVKLYDDFYIAPVFCYEERQNVIASVGEENLYVPYLAVKNNEFFAASEEALQYMETLKTQMLSQYRPM